MADKKMKAYFVQGNEYGVIVYATNSATARREGAGELCEEWENIDYCRRAHWADQYIGKEIPCKAWWENGYWLECGWCESQIWDEDSKDKIVINNRAFCCPNCAHEFMKRGRL